MRGLLPVPWEQKQYRRKLHGRVQECPSPLPAAPSNTQKAKRKRKATLGKLIYFSVNKLSTIWYKL